MHRAPWQTSANPAHSLLTELCSASGNSGSSPGPGTDSPWDRIDMGMLRRQTKMTARRVLCFLGGKASLWGSHKIIPILVHVHNPGTAAWNISRPDEISQDFSAAAAEAPVGYVGCAHRKQKAKPHFLLAFYPSMCRNCLWCCSLANGGIYNYNLLFSAYYMQSNILNLCHDFSTKWFSQCIPGNYRKVPKTPSVSLWAQNIFHNNSKMLFPFFTLIVLQWSFLEAK